MLRHQEAFIRTEKKQKHCIFHVDLTLTWWENSPTCSPLVCCYDRWKGEWNGGVWVNEEWLHWKMTFEALNVTSPANRDHLLPLERTIMICKGTNVGSFSKVWRFTTCGEAFPRSRLILYIKICFVHPSPSSSMITRNQRLLHEPHKVKCFRTSRHVSLFFTISSLPGFPARTGFSPVFHRSHQELAE